MHGAKDNHYTWPILSWLQNEVSFTKIKIYNIIIYVYIYMYIYIYIYREREREREREHPGVS